MQPLVKQAHSSWHGLIWAAKVATMSSLHERASWLSRHARHAYLNIICSRAKHSTKVLATIWALMLEFQEATPLFISRCVIALIRKGMDTCLSEQAIHDRHTSVVWERVQSSSVTLPTKGNCDSTTTSAAAAAMPVARSYESGNTDVRSN
eukprot:4845550-Amphidinium_carterae.1